MQYPLFPPEVISGHPLGMSLLLQDVQTDKRGASKYRTVCGLRADPTFDTHQTLFFPFLVDLSSYK